MVFFDYKTVYYDAITCFLILFYKSKWYYGWNRWNVNYEQTIVAVFVCNDNLIKIRTRKLWKLWFTVDLLKNKKRRMCGVVVYQIINCNGPIDDCRRFIIKTKCLYYRFRCVHIHAYHLWKLALKISSLHRSIHDPPIIFMRFNTDSSRATELIVKIVQI